MRITQLCSGLVLAGLMALTGVGLAGPSPDGVIFLHLVPTETPHRAKCSGHGVDDYSKVRTAGELNKGYLAYVLLAGVDTTQGVTGIQFGISHGDSTALDITWTSCALYEWPTDDWPASNTGNLLTWDQHEDCQNSVPVVVGYFYVRAKSPVRFRLIPRPVDQMTVVASCGMNNLNSPERLDRVRADNLGWVDFGGGQGYNPWDPDQNLEAMQNKFKPIKQ